MIAFFQKTPGKGLFYCILRCVTAEQLNGKMISCLQVFPSFFILMQDNGAGGCDCTLELAMEGKDVTLVEMQDAIAKKMVSCTRDPLIYALKENHVRILTNAKVSEVTDEGAWIQKNDQKEFPGADMIIDAFGVRPKSKMADDIFNRYGNISALVGDCEHTAQISEAVRGGYFAASSIHCLVRRTHSSSSFFIYSGSGQYF